MLLIKKYVDFAIADKASNTDLQTTANNLSLLISNNLPLDGRRSMTGNLNMGGNEIVNIKPFVEDDKIQPQQDNHAITFGYFHTERGELKRLINETGYDALNRKNPDPMEDDIDMGDNRIVNLKDPIFLQDVVNKRYLDTRISNIDPTHLLPIDGSRAMTNNLDMDNHKILNLKEPTDDKDVANKQYIDKLIDETVQQTVEENVFKRVMDYDEFKEDDDDIHKIGVENKDFYKISKKTYKFEIDYDLMKVMVNIVQDYQLM